MAANKLRIGIWVRPDMDAAVRYWLGLYLAPNQSFLMCKFTKKI